MFKNYFKTAFRNFRKDKFYTSLNITGLAIGIATCLLIMLYVHDELSYDSYNIQAENIYRINNEVKFGDNYFDLAQTPPLMGPEAVKQFPEIQQYTRLRWHGSLAVKKGNANIRENNIGYADSTLFKVFTLPMISGDPATALKGPHSLVITETIAKKYFDRTDVAGQNMIINDTVNYRITGVIKDIPQNSHFKFDFFVPLSEDPNSRDDNWLSENYNTYVLVKKNAEPGKVGKKIEDMLVRFAEPELQSVLHMGMDEFTKQGGLIKCSLTPLLAIHLHSNKIGELRGNGNIQYVYIFSAIALFILVIACVNFMNLFTARSSNRAKEVGVRKVLGSLRKNLIAQFLTESLLISFIAFIISLLIAWLVLPYFNQLAGKDIHFSFVLQPVVLAVLIPAAILVGFLAGGYPAFVLSAFQPIDVLKGSIAKGFKGSRMRNILVVFQFAISITLIVGTLVIYRQLSYIRNKDLGFNRQQVLVVKNTDVLKAQAKSFKNELGKINGIAGVTMTGYLPVEGYRNNDAYFTSPAMDSKTAISLQTWFVDQDYIPTFDMKVMKGRNFSDQFLTDSNAIILNEAAAAFLGANGQLNKTIYSISDIKTKKLIQYHIIGVIKNFNFNSLRDVITPLALFFGKHESGSVAIRMDRANIPNILSQVKNKWESMAPGQSFDYAFMDDEFNELYDAEQRTGKIFISFAVLAIVIASMGLFGLAAYAAEQRVREIGIRKVLGASATNIVRMLSADFLKLVLLSAIFAFPLAWWIMSKWLQDFAYRVAISWWIFAVAGIAALFIALITVCYQAIKAAVANPVKSLRTE